MSGSYSPNPNTPPERLVVGLGNPGSEYERTRHNLGFEVLDALAHSMGLSFSRLARSPGLSGRVKARVALGGPEPEGVGDSRPFLLVKPYTYMNLSGVVVAALLRHYEIAAESLFVVYDDLNLPLGRLRIRPGGSHGGHNGIRSLLTCLGTEGFPRLRLGIGVADADSSTMADPDFVLARYTAEEGKLLEPVLARAVAVCKAWLEGATIQELMAADNGFDARGMDDRPAES